MIMTKPKYLTLEFWAALISGALLIVVALGLLNQEEKATWETLLVNLVAAVLPLAALIVGYSNQRTQLIMAGLTTEDAPPWMTAEFWMTIIATLSMVLVAARIVTQEQADIWKQLLAPAVAAVLAIVAYVRGRVGVRAQASLMALR